MWSGSSRSASRPAYSLGWSVLTRPPMISGKPVKSSIARTSRPASASSRAVPPVDTSSIPSPASPCAKSAMPRLSETDSSARRTRTSPGCVIGAHDTAASLHRDGPAGDQPDGVAEEVVLQRPQRFAHLGDAAGAGQLERALGDDRAGVDALVDEVDRDAEHLDAVRDGLLDGADAREGGQQRGVDVDHALGEAGEEARAEQ